LIADILGAMSLTESREPADVDVPAAAGHGPEGAAGHAPEGAAGHGPEGAAGAGRAVPIASHRTNIVTALLSLWFAVGLLLDAWAHNNVPELESFFTPWHAVFYTGFVATAAWIRWTVRHAFLPAPNAAPDAAPAGYRAAMPAGYRAAVYAVPAFALAGLGDMVWHVAFGVEQTIDILFSPTHLGLVATMLIILTAPLRSAWADVRLPVDPGPWRLLPSLLSVALGATLVLLIVQYANVLWRDEVGVLFGLSAVDEAATDVFVSSLMITSLILVVPLLALARRWVLPFGAATLLYLFTGGLSTAISGFENIELVAAFVVAGICVDLLARWVRPGPSSVWRYRLFGALAPLVTWSIYLVAADLLAPAVRYAPDIGGGGAPLEPMLEIYTGAPVVQGLLGLLLAVLLSLRTPAPAAGPAPGAAGSAQS
jgi:hypothetical protein